MLTAFEYKGKRYQEVERKANVGELVKVVAADKNVTHCYKKGDVVTVTEHSWSRGYPNHVPTRTDNSNHWLRDDQYVVLEPIADSDDSDDTRIATLEATVKSLAERVEALEAGRKSYVYNGPVGVTFSSVDKPKAAPLTREQVVEMAKKDVETLMKQWRPKVPSIVEPGYNGYFDPTVDDVRFVENRKKRTVVALIVAPEVGDNDWYRGTWARGVSKCAPDDVFNVHIGKAIALRRALGLDVPDEYVNAPKPTEAQVGDVVWLVNSKCPLDVTQGIVSTVNGQIHRGIIRILDDSHDFGGEGR